MEQETGVKGWEGQKTIRMHPSIPVEEGIKRTSALSHRCHHHTSHPPSTAVISQRGGKPYGYRELLSEIFWAGEMPQNSPLSILSDAFSKQSHFQILPVSAELVSAFVNKQELPQFPFSSFEKEKE